MRKFNDLTHTLLLSTLLWTAGGTMYTQAQTDTTAVEEKKKARLSLDYFCTNNSEQQLVASVKTRIEGRFENVPGATVHLYKDLIVPENFLAKLVTGNDGRATYTLPKAIDTATAHTYIIAIENDSVFEDTEKETTITKAWIELTTEEQDSIKTVNVFVGVPDSDGNMQPVADVPVSIFIKRLFGELPLTKEAESTDEEGFVRVEIPPDIPGDKNGDYTLIGRVSEHEMFGNLAASRTVSWGIPLSLNESAQLQELWLSSANTSKAILIITIVLLFCIFGVVLYIFRQLVNISRLG